MAGASDIRAGGAFVEIFTKDGAFQQGMTRIQNRLKSVGASMRSAGKDLMAVGGAIAGPILGAAYAFAQVGSELNDMSARTGASVEALSALKFAAEQTGTSMEGVEKGVKKMQKVIFDASNGSKQAATALARVGTSAQELAGMSADQQLAKIADGLAAVQDPGARAALAMQIFGKAGTDLVPLLSQGGAGIQAFVEQARKLGLVMSAEDAKKADEFGDALDAMKASLGAAFREIGSAVAPQLKAFAEYIAGAAAKVGTFIRNNQALVQNALKIGAVIAGAGAAIYGLGYAIGFVSKSIAMFQAAMTVIPALFNPVTLAIGGVVAGLALFVVAGRQLSPSFKRETDAMAAALMRLDFAAAGKLLMLNLQLAFGSGWASIKDGARNAIEGVTQVFEFLWDKATEGLDRFLGLFGTDILSMQASFEKLGLYFRAAFDWTWAYNNLNKALKAVDARVEKERARAPTADARAKERDQARADRAAEREAANRAAADADQKGLDAIRAERDAARRAALGEPDKPAEQPAATPARPDMSGWMPDETKTAAAAKSAAAATIGTFSASIAGQLGVGPQLTAAERTADAVEATAENTAAMLDSIDTLDEDVVAMPEIPSDALRTGVAAATAAGESPVAPGQKSRDDMSETLIKIADLISAGNGILTKINGGIASLGVSFT